MKCKVQGVPVVQSWLHNRNLLLSVFSRRHLTHDSYVPTPHEEDPQYFSRMCDIVRKPAQTVQVRSVDEEDHLTLNFRLKGKEHHLHRFKQEALSKTLRRIILTVCKDEKERHHVRRKHLSPTPADVESIGAHVYRGGSEGREEVPSETPNSEAWVCGNMFVLDDTSYTIAVNTPNVLYLKLPDCIMSGYAVAPQVQLDFAEPEISHWTWRRCGSKQVTLAATPRIYPQNGPGVIVSPGESVQPVCSALSACPIIGTSLVYTVTPQDYNHHLSLECTPRNASGEEGYPVIVTSAKVQTGLHNGPIEERHLFTPCFLKQPNQFRMVTYNILASYYGSSDYAHELLYSYCTPHALDQEYRQCLIAKELLGYHADVICLQEVGAKCFSQFLFPVMHQNGFDGYFHAKAGQVQEGEAIFFNCSKFSLVSEEVVVLRQFVHQHPGCRHLLSLHPLILNNLLKRHNILQVVFLKMTESPGRYLCVANTHLFYHPMGDHIRLLQVEICIKYLESAMEKFKQKVGMDAEVAVAFCGDFNSCPCIAAYNYILSGVVSKDHPDWQVYRMTEIPPCNCDHKSLSVIHEDDEHQLESELKALEETDDGSASGEAVDGLDLNHRFHFSNACGTTHATNITISWKGVLDYIFIDSDHLAAERMIPLPPDEQLTEFVALPSIYFPSDHVALAVDLKWKSDS